MRNSEELKPSTLAFIGDAVQTLYVRNHFSFQGDYKVNELTRMVKEKVNAGAQCRFFKSIEDSLTEKEADVARRARNAVKGQRAKNYSVYEYNHATALEALFGYLYVTNQTERLNELLEKSLREV